MSTKNCVCVCVRVNNWWISRGVALTLFRCETNEALNDCVITSNSSNCALCSVVCCVSHLKQIRDSQQKKLKKNRQKPASTDLASLIREKKSASGVSMTQLAWLNGSDRERESGKSWRKVSGAVSWNLYRQQISQLLKFSFDRSNRQQQRHATFTIYNMNRPKKLYYDEILSHHASVRPPREFIWVGTSM